MTKQQQQRRWYDQDPLVSMALDTLQRSNDEDQIRLAMHLIKIIGEHNLEQDGPATRAGAEDDTCLRPGEPGNSRWYDVDRNLKTSIEMLRCCPVDTQRLIAKDLAVQIRTTLQERQD